MNTNEIINEDKLDLVISLKSVMERILKLDSNDEDEDLQYCFKVLIFDDYTFDIICPLLKVIHHIKINRSTPLERIMLLFI
jgi:hypothetical protein